MSDELKIDVRRSGKRFEAEALMQLPATLETVWGTITDYDALPGFMPGIRACRVLERHDQGRGVERLVAEQLGEFRFMLFSQSMKVRLHIEHQHLRMAEAKAVEFELGLLRKRAIDVFEGRYELSAAPARRGAAPSVALRYTAVIELHLPPPPAVGNLAVQKNLADQLRAVRQEVLRRSL